MERKTDDLKCPQCGCSRLYIKEKGMSTWKLIANGICLLIPHPIAKLLGLLLIFNNISDLEEKDCLVCKCPKCGHSWVVKEKEEDKTEKPEKKK